MKKIMLGEVQNAANTISCGFMSVSMNWETCGTSAN